MENIFAIIIYMTLFLLLIRIIFENYIHHSKKYKDFNIIKKVSKIANNNKAIVILDVIANSFIFVFCIQFLGLVVFVSGIALFGNIDTFKGNEKLIEFFAHLNNVAFMIWIFSILITSIYYIITCVKEMKATKNES